MAEVKLTKNELRMQQQRLSQLQKYLPTLQLKKALLQIEVNTARLEIDKLEENFEKDRAHTQEYAALLTDKAAIDPKKVAKVSEIKRWHENIAGVDVPYFESLTFADFPYDLFDTPPWVDGVVTGLRELITSSVKVEVAREKKELLKKSFERYLFG